MKFLVTYVKLGRTSWKRQDKSETQLIDTCKDDNLHNPFFHDGTPRPSWIGRRFEMIRQDEHTITKVVDIREVLR